MKDEALPDANRALPRGTLQTGCSTTGHMANFYATGAIKLAKLRVGDACSSTVLHVLVHVLVHAFGVAVKQRKAGERAGIYLRW